MKTKIYDKKGVKKGDIELPSNFSTKIRKDILAKTYEAHKGKFMSSYGSMKGAGAGYSASGIVKHKRHDWKSAYGKGISRIPRKVMSRHGSSFNWIGATVSGTRGGRRPHSPRSEKNPFRKINKKEELIAFNSALTGTIDLKSLESKYHKKVNSGAIFDLGVLGLKTKEFKAVIAKVLELKEEEVFKKKSIRAGMGKQRGRKYKSNAGILFVISSREKMNRKGLSVVNVDNLTIRDLAPNGEPGRVTCYSEASIKEIKEKFK